MGKLWSYEPVSWKAMPTVSNGEFDKVKCVWELLFPSMKEEVTWIQIDGKYIISLGAYYPHTYHLLSNCETISYIQAQEICDLLSYFFDTIIDVGYPLSAKRSKADFRGLAQITKLLGNQRRDRSNIHQQLFEVKETLASVYDSFIRISPGNPRRHQGKLLAFQLPTDQGLKNGLHAYWQGLFSIDPTGAILNYWRVLEATATSVAQRDNIFRQLFTSRLQPVPCLEYISGRPQFNLISRYKRFVRKRYYSLIRHHGSPEAAMEFLYKNR